MHRRGRRIVRLLSVGAFVALGLQSAPATAYHTVNQRITDRMAYTPRQGAFRAGLSKLEYGIVDSLSVKTYWLPWLLLVPNGQVKWRFIGEDPFSLSFDAGVFYLDTELLTYIKQDWVQARIVVVPLELLGSYRLNEMHTVSLTTLYTPVYLRGTVDSEAGFGIGRGAVENLQLTTTYELRVSRVTAFTFTGRLVLYQGGGASSEVVYHPDEYTTVEVFGGGTGRQGELVGKGSLVASSVFSWKTWNMKVGAGYGHYNLAGFNFVALEPSALFAFDLYWIWGGDREASLERSKARAR